MKKVLSILIMICLIAGLLPVIASAATTAKVSIISDASGATTTLETEEGGEAKYMVTDADGLAHTETASATNYQIKFEWKSGGKPTLTLNGANLKHNIEKKKAISISEGPDEYVIAVEKESAITTVGGEAIIAYGKSLTVTGPAKLNLNVKNGSAIMVYDEAKPKTRSLTILDADIDLTLEKEEGVSRDCFGFSNHVRYLTVDGGTIKAKVIGKTPLFRGWGEMTITGGAQLDLDCDDGNTIYLSAVAGSENINPTGFTMESGHLKIRKAGGACIQVTDTVDGYVKINGGTIDAVGGAFIYGPIVDLSGYTAEHTLVVCNSTDGKGAETYDVEKAEAMNKYCYWQLTLGASYEVTVKNGTVDKSVANSGDTVTITARIAPEGKAFDKWEVNEGTITLADPTATSTTFVMPSENVKITALYKTVETEEDETPGESTEESTPEVSTPDVSTPDASTPDASTPEASTPDTDNNEGNNQPAKKDSKTGIVVLFIVIDAVLILGTGAAIAYIIISRNKKESGAAAATEETEEVEQTEATEETEESAE